MRLGLGVDHTVLPANHTTPAFTRSSPGGATTEWTVIAPADEAYYSFIDPVGMKGWVCIINNNNNNIVICKAHKVSSKAESEEPAVAR